MNLLAKRLCQRGLGLTVSRLQRSLSSTGESFLNGTSIAYVEQMQEAWKADPKSVHVSWNAYFTNVAKGISPPIIAPPGIGAGQLPQAAVAAAVGTPTSAQDIANSLKIFQLVTAYQLKGHELADLDPLSKEEG